MLFSPSCVAPYATYIKGSFEEQTDELATDLDLSFIAGDDMNREFPNTH